MNFSAALSAILFRWLPARKSEAKPWQTPPQTEGPSALGAYDRIRYAIEGSGDAWWDWRIDTDTIDYSPCWAHMLGYPAHEIGARFKQWEALLHPQDRFDLHAALKPCLSGHAERFRVEFRARRQDGDYRWILARGKVFARDAEQSARRILGTFSDVQDQRRAEVALREAEQRWQYALEGSDAGVWDWDLRSGKIYRSARWHEQLGYTREEVGATPMAWEALVHPEDLPRALRQRQQHFKGQTPAFCSELRVRRSNGEYIWMQIHGRVVARGLHGEPLRMIGTQTDIAARKQAELEVSQLLSDREAMAKRLQLQLDRMPIASIILNGQEEVEYWNPAAERMFGHNAGAAIGRSLPQLLEIESQCPLMHELRMRLSGNEETTHAEFDCYAKDGRLLHCEWHNTTLRDAGTTRVLAMVMDVSTKRRAAHALAQSERRYRTLVELSPDGIVKLSEGKLQYANEAFLRMLGASGPEEVVGKEFASFFAESEQEAVRERMHAMDDGREGAGSGTAEYSMHTIAGTAFDADVRAAGFLWRNKRMVQVVVRDVTVRRRVHKQVVQLNSELERRVRERTADLEAANRELEAFSYSVAHDLRAPLRAIEAYTRILEEEHGAGLSGDAFQYFERVRVNSTRMAHLIDDLLALARVGQCGLVTGDVDMQRLAATVLEEVKAAYPPADVSVGSLPVVQGDPALLHQVLANLLDNALKFCARATNPQVSLSCETSPAEFIFEVSDNGVGFEMSYAPKLFGVFQRLHGMSEYEGTGVGLAIVQRAMQRQRGRVWAESRPNAGASFYFALPRAKLGH